MFMGLGLDEGGKRDGDIKKLAPPGLVIRIE